MKRFAMILAETTEHGIGKNNHLPWDLPNEFRYFIQKTKELRDSTKQNALIMGRLTWDSIPPSRRPMPNRINIVVSSQVAKKKKEDSNDDACDVRVTSQIPDSVAVVPSLEHALHHLSHPDIANTVDKIWILGGARLYTEGMAHEACEEIYVTTVYGTFDCDVFWPGVDSARFREDVSYAKEQLENGVKYTLRRFVRRPPHPELGYLQLAKEILTSGVRQNDRTGVGTLSLFGRQLRFDLSEGFPLLTTKKVFWKGVKEELLWFIAGNTCATDLAKKGVHIWDENASRKFLDSCKLTDYPEGELGPVYGFQWRHFGAQYVPGVTGTSPEYEGKGVDQLQQCIQQIRKDPASRRIIMSAWNPLDLPKMALPPCHVMCQFSVADGKLSCHLYQRSADMGLGVPFNIASYALLTHLVAHVCKLQVGEFIHSFGDVHVYLNHVDGMQLQLQRQPLPFPKLKLRDGIDDITKIQSEDIELLDYQSHAPIKLDMAL